MEMKGIIVQLTKTREEKGLTQKELASLAGMAQQSVNRIEAGKHSPKIDTVEKIANALGYRLAIEKI